MCYFEIARPSARHILTYADPNAAGEPRSCRLRNQWRLGCRNSRNPSICQGRKRHLIGSHIGGIYRP